MMMLSTSLPSSTPVTKSEHEKEKFEVFDVTRNETSLKITQNPKHSNSEINDEMCFNACDYL